MVTRITTSVILEDIIDKWLIHILLLLLLVIIIINILLYHLLTVTVVTWSWTATVIWPTTLLVYVVTGIIIVSFFTKVKHYSSIIQTDIVLAHLEHGLIGSVLVTGVLLIVTYHH